MEEQPAGYALPAETSRKEIWGWAFYDFANSAYSTAVAGVIFNVYFSEFVVGQEGVRILGARVAGSSLWGYSVSLSMLLVALSSPVLGAIADFTGSKKRFLFGFCYSGVLVTGLLYFVKPGRIWLGVAVYVLSNFLLEASFGFYNAFLPEIAPSDRLGRISGFGWALGYVGGVLCLVLNLLMIRNPSWFGLDNGEFLPVRTSLVVVALWWGLFSLPTLAWLRERAPSRPLPAGVSYFRVGFGRIYQTFRRIRAYKELAKFLVIFLIYNDGIQTVIVMGAVFGAEELKMSQDELILCFILIQAVAFVGALIFGFLSDRISIKFAISASLVIWTVTVFYVLFIRESWQFWMLGGLIGFVLGGSQSASRALFASFTPAANSAEFFGFFATSGKFASLLGPLLYGVVRQWTGTTRYAVVSIVVFFLVGLVGLRFVNEPLGEKESLRAVEEI